ncbi:MAG: cytochrome c [Acidobacteria bacterium]|nr:cytochrome c [Acidobacteriota bacterium]
MTPRNILNVFLLVVLVTVLSLNFVIRRDPGQRNVEIMAEMVNSVAYESQAENPAVVGGNTALQPVSGTIARGFMPLHYEATPEDAKRAGAELMNPFAAEDARSLDRGATVYANFCAVCHGATGLGDGPVTTRGFPPPPSLNGENALKMSDGQMFHILTYGQKNMPSYPSQVTRGDRWSVILYIRSLQKQTQRPTPPPPPPGVNP